MEDSLYAFLPPEVAAIVAVGQAVGFPTWAIAVLVSAIGIFKVLRQILARVVEVERKSENRVSDIEKRLAEIEAATKLLTQIFLAGRSDVSTKTTSSGASSAEKTFSAIRPSHPDLSGPGNSGRD